jgi:DNA mismatch endonuclease (patch repair protein)
MADRVDKATRSRIMAGIKTKNSALELAVRREIHKRGFRYLLHDGSLPGRPDLVLPKWSAVIFAHGCFWHMHNCRYFHWPQTTPERWRQKLLGNLARDKRNIACLEHAGWRIAIVWECATKGAAKASFPLAMHTLGSWLHSDDESIVIRGG